jgi:hypothetical protein
MLPQGSACQLEIVQAIEPAAARALSSGAPLRDIGANNPRAPSAKGIEARAPPVQRSVRCSVFVRHPTLAIDCHHGEVVVGIVHRVASCPIADFEIDDVLASLVDEAMGVAASRLEAGAYAGLKRCAARVSEQGRAAFENVNKLILLRVRMAQSRATAGGKARDVDAEIREPEQIPEGPLVAARLARGERFGIIGAKGPRRRLGGRERDRGAWRLRTWD